VTTSAIAACTVSKPLLTLRRKRSPASVNVKLRVLRSNSRRPRLRSSCATLRLIAAGVMMSNHPVSRPSLAGKVALVTGGSRSIGAAIACRLAADGAKVAITFNASAGRASEVVHHIEVAGGKAMALRADAANPGDVKHAVASTMQQFGRLDILVNNAGIAIIKLTEVIGVRDRGCLLSRRRRR
jgi:hypothetical protein